MKSQSEEFVSLVQFVQYVIMKDLVLFTDSDCYFRKD